MAVEKHLRQSILVLYGSGILNLYEDFFFVLSSSRVHLNIKRFVIISLKHVTTIAGLYLTVLSVTLQSMTWITV